jgi:hypothetical protein
MLYIDCAGLFTGVKIGCLPDVSFISFAPFNQYVKLMREPFGRMDAFDGTNELAQVFSASGTAKDFKFSLILYCLAKLLFLGLARRRLLAIRNHTSVFRDF